MPWYWNEASNRYHHRNGTEYFMSRQQVLDYVNQSISAAGNVTDQLASLVANGQLAPTDWNDLMRQEIKDEYIRQYLLGRGGREQMTAQDWGSIGGMIGDQYRFLDGFFANVATGELTEAQIAARARMYINSAREGFERGQARAYGLSLPQYPGDGRTVCLCITTPESLVLTKRGWLPLLDVRVGDLVWTHRGRWKPVTALVVKDSIPAHRATWLIAPDGRCVGCTNNHLWLTESGWHDAGALIGGRISCLYLPPIIEDDLGCLRNLGGLTTCKPVVKFGDLLPAKTKVYDLTVEDDHSFVIEGFIAHNTNCNCEWRYEEVYDGGGNLVGYDCYWEINPAVENCVDCQENNRKWYPLFVTV